MATPGTGRTLLYDALAQNDVDMAHHRLLNLDTSNLPPVGIPPTIHPPENEWLHDWDSALQEWTSTQPRFTHIGGTLTNFQMLHITEVGIIRRGTWEGDVLDAAHVPVLSAIRAPTDNITMAGFRLTNVGMPVDPGDAVNLGYIDALLQGLQVKEAVRCASTGPLTPASLDRPVDGVTLEAGDRVLVKNQISGREYEHGIYVASTGAWNRATDCDSDEELDRAYCAVLEGTVNAGSSWVNISGPLGHWPPLVTDVINFVIFSTGLDIIAGAGLERDGQTINVLGTAARILVGATVDIDPAYAGQASITTLGTITSGIWNGDVLLSDYGGTGQNNNGHTITLSDSDLSVEKIGLAIPDASLVLQIEGGVNTIIVPATGTMATLAGVEILSNKRITARVTKIASNSAPAINVDTLNAFYITALSEAIISMTNNLSGTPTDCQELVLWIKDNGTSRAITWNTATDAWADSSDLPLPTATTPSVWLFLRFIYNSEILRWVLTEKLNNITP